MNTNTNKKISIIVPVYNEVGIITEFMDHLKPFKDHCEIIFVDGGSRDGTDKMIKERYRIVNAPKKGRGHQMNYGASLSKGEILLFLHVDTFIPKDALSQISRIMSKGFKVGCFKIQFESRSFLMKICGFMSNRRVQFRNIAFGDQGIYINKAYFDGLGGFSDIPIMEDYQLSMDIKADGEKIALAKSKVQTSERRFVENGRIKTMARMQRLQYLYRKGEDTKVLANRYR